MGIGAQSVISVAYMTKYCAVLTSAIITTKGNEGGRKPVIIA